MSIYEKLYDWQKRVVDKFKDKENFGLFLDMGLGKTPLGLALAEQNHCTKVIIITINAKALETTKDSGSWFWWAEKSSMNYSLLNKWSKTFSSNPEVLLINYESLFSRSKSKTERVALKDNVKAFIESCKAHNVAILVDESHKMKNLQSQQTCAIMKLKRELQRVANSVHSYLLTGTPFTTGYVDLYAQLKMLGCDMTKGQFIDDFCVRGQVPGLLGWQQPIVGYKNVNSLFNLLHKYAITIKSEDVIELPEKVFSSFCLQESEEFNAFVQEKMTSNEIMKIANAHSVNHQTSLWLDTGRGKINNPFFRDIDFPRSKWLAETSGQFWLRARQLSIGFNGSAEEAIWYDRTRLDRLEKFLSENEDNYLLFYNFTPELLEIYDICEKLGYNIDVYCGECKSLHFYKKFEQLTEGEKLTSKKNIILANFASGSTGLNWQEFNKCIIFSIPLFSHYEQAIKRIHRTGQTKTTFYYSFYQNNWLDSGMQKALETCQEYDSKMFESDLKRVNSLISD